MRVYLFTWDIWSSSKTNCARFGVFGRVLLTVQGDVAGWPAGALGTAEVLQEDKRMGIVGGCRGAKVAVGACPRATRLDVSGEVRTGY